MKRRSSLVGVLSLVFVAGCTSTSASSRAATTPATPGGAGVTVNLTNSNQFQPATLTVARGTTVTWVNTGFAPHTVTDDSSKAAKPTDALLPSGAQSWDAGMLNGGQSFTHTFDTPGEYAYFCVPHESSGMVAHITVTS